MIFLPIIIGPVTPPAGLWKPPASFQPPAGNYVHLVSDTAVFQPVINKTMAIDNLYRMKYTMTSEHFDIRAGEYRIAFRGIDGLPQLIPGYYAGLKHFSEINPAKGAFGISPEGSCSESESWVVVEQVSYEQDELVSLDLRFEINCSPQANRTNGVVHWVKPR